LAPAKHSSQKKKRRYSFAYKPATYVAGLIRSSCRSPIGGFSVQYLYPEVLWQPVHGLH